MRSLLLPRHAVAVLFAAAVTLSGCASGGGRAEIGTGLATAQVVIINESNETVYRIFMSATAQGTWGPDQLGSSVLARGNRFRLTNIRPGTWDIRVVDRSGNWKEFRNQSLRAGREYTLTVNAGNWTRG